MRGARVGGWVHGGQSPGLMPLCISGVEGGGEGRAAAVEVLASVISSLYPEALILTSLYTRHHGLLLPPSICYPVCPPLGCV